MSTKVVITDGGRMAAGFKDLKTRRDCVTQAIAVATGLPYREVWDELARRKAAWIKGRRGFALEPMTDGRFRRIRARDVKPTTPDRGVSPQVYRAWLSELGWRWTPTMRIGGGCQVHLRAAELPPGRLIVRVSRHLCAVIDGVVHDSHDCTRNGSRCVYGYWKQAEPIFPATGDAEQKPDQSEKDDLGGPA